VGLWVGTLPQRPADSIHRPATDVERRETAPQRGFLLAEAEVGRSGRRVSGQKPLEFLQTGPIQNPVKQVERKLFHAIHG